MNLLILLQCNSSALDGEGSHTFLAKTGRVQSITRGVRQLIKRPIMKKALTVLGSIIILGIALGVNGDQATDSRVFSPLFEVYQHIQDYFYNPEQINDQEALYGAIKGMVEQLDDPYSEFLRPEDYQDWEQSLRGEFSGVGIEITIKDDTLTIIAPLAGTPAEQAGLRAGDRILKIDGESTEGITLSAAATKIRGEEGTSVSFLIQHKDGTQEEIEIVRKIIVVKSVTSELVGEGRIAYIRISRFGTDATIDLDTALVEFNLENLDGMILDLRNNPGGLLREAISVSKRFVDQNMVIVSTIGRIAGKEQFWSTGNLIPNLPLAVLINGGTASAAEITAAAIRDHEMGILIGERSFGKGSIQRVFQLPDGSALKLTTGEYFTPLGQAVNEVGLSPDISIEQGEDPIEAAIAWINAHVGARMPIALNKS